MSMIGRSRGNKISDEKKSDTVLKRERERDPAVRKCQPGELGQTGSQKTKMMKCIKVRGERYLSPNLFGDGKEESDKFWCQKYINRGSVEKRIVFLKKVGVGGAWRFSVLTGGEWCENRRKDGHISGRIRKASCNVGCWSYTKIIRVQFRFRRDGQFLITVILTRLMGSGPAERTS